MRRFAEGCLLPGFAGSRAPAWLLRRLEAGLGGVVVFGRNVVDPAQLATLTGQIHDARPDALVAIDEEGGIVTRLEAATGSSYPGNLALGAVNDVGLTERVAASIGAELAAAGIDLDLAPVADVNTNPLNPVIGVRSFGASPELVAAHTAAFVRGLQEVGVAACAKHFPGHGDTAVDSHRGLPVATGGPAALEVALAPFRAAAKARARAVMSAHIVVPELDSGPATLSRRVLTGLLREELGFGGMVITDALDMAAIAGTIGTGEAAVRAIAAGADAICVGGYASTEDELAAIVGTLVGAVQDGRLSEARLEEAAGRMAAVARWAAGARRPGVAPDREVGMVAARRALQASDVTPLDGPPVVVDLKAAPNIAAGTLPWGLPEALAARAPGARIVRGDPPPVPHQIAKGRPLVLVVHDLHRNPRHEAFVDEVLAHRLDPVVVEMGLPIHRPAAARHYLATHGASRVSAQAAAELLIP